MLWEVAHQTAPDGCKGALTGGPVGRLIGRVELVADPDRDASAHHAGLGLDQPEAASSRHGLPATRLPDEGHQLAPSES